ncbi:MAG: hypothetical protein IJY12_02820 [Clostridia bacterium]|nr:hypothetical protein [Clostridia bacterium]
MNQLLTMAKNYLCSAQISWAICGGYALDLFLDRDLRVHSDIDICVFENDRDTIFQYMMQNAWRVYEFRGQGKLRPLDAASSSEVGRNLMCINGDCELVKFYPCEDEELLYHEFFHTGINKFNYMELLFNTINDNNFVFDETLKIERDMSKAILFNDGIPYLAPEIVLLFKSRLSDKADYHYDFEQTYLHMNDEQKTWFSKNLDKLYPSGHIWKVWP